MDKRRIREGIDRGGAKRDREKTKGQKGQRHMRVTTGKVWKEQ